MRIVSFILGALLLIGGVYCLFTPIQTYATISWLIGLSMIVEGVGDIILWNEWRKQGQASGWMLAGAIVSIVLGVMLLGSFAAQVAIDVFIAYFIAIWLVIGGIARIVTALSIRKSQTAHPALSSDQPSWGVLLALGILNVILGVLCLFNPLAIMIGVGIMLGVSIVCVGGGLIALAVNMRS